MLQKIQLFFFNCLLVQTVQSQELYVFSEPASNMPAHAVSAKLGYRSPLSPGNNIYRQRYTPELMFGFNRQWMVHISGTFSDFYSAAVRAESVKGYAKFRFYSNDDVHRHFRIAAFAEASYSRSPFYYGDINLDGDNSGVQAGLIATQLVNKLAISGTASVIKVVAHEHEHLVYPGNPRQALYYSLSAGYLLFPLNYTSYRQTNLNIYFETVGMKGFEGAGDMLDLAPALQLIFNSNFKINLGARFQAAGNMVRPGERNFYVSAERTFLGALQHRKKS